MFTKKLSSGLSKKWPRCPLQQTRLKKRRKERKTDKIWSSWVTTK